MKNTTHIRAVARETGMRPQNLSRLAKQHGVAITDRAKLAALALDHRQSDRSRAVDPETGLSYSDRKNLAHARKLELDNEERSKTLGKDWTRSEEHLSILKGLCTKLDQAPAKIKSQAGLTPEQTAIVQKTLDDLRREFVNEEPLLNTTPKP